MVTILIFSSLVFSQLPEWTFDKEEILSKWVPNFQIVDVKVSDGRLLGRTSGSDPYLLCEGLDFDATPYQYVKVKIKVDRGGTGQLFWTGTEEGPYGGLSQEKSTFFIVEDTTEWQEICIIPLWHKEGKIKKIRFDLYENVNFEIEKISILSWDKGTPPLNNVYEWSFPDGDISAWKLDDSSCKYFLSPPLELQLGKKTYVTVEYSNDSSSLPISFIWGSKNISGPQIASIPVCKAGRHFYALEISSNYGWIEPLVVIGFIISDTSNIKVYSVHISEEPAGKPELFIDYLGPHSAINRENKPFTVRARFTNLSGGVGEIKEVNLVVPDNIEIEGGPLPSPPYLIEYGDLLNVSWKLKSSRAGKYQLKVRATTNEGSVVENTGVITVLPSVHKIETDYVPEPKPIKTKVDLCAFYFPGWDTPEKWDCIMTVAPMRKPALGFYNEGNPECVDWQIKWAVENGIKCFLVDWYWVAGKQSLTHWFEAYRKAKYRDYLKVAIMWANHNPPKTHSPEDWEKVNLEWIEKYFNLPSYYKIDNKPLICIWSPENLRNDIGGTEVVKSLLSRSQELAKEHGYDGIVFMAINNNQSPSEVKILLDEGYTCFTNYHEFKKALFKSPVANYTKYEYVVDTSLLAWREKNSFCEGITYYPLVETGWDSRPWHGPKALVIAGRTTELFRDLLSQARGFAEETSKKMIVIGPLNEWGEGSYIEPNVEFGFSMYEAIRDVFVSSTTEPLPVNIAPEDVGMGPYDFQFPNVQTSWDFHEDVSGWKVLNGIENLKVVEGSLTGKTVGENPSIYYFFYETEGIPAYKYPRATIRLRLDGVPESVSQVKLSWAYKGLNFNETNSIILPMRADGKYYIYTFDLRSHPRWLGRIKSIKITPTLHNSAVFWIDSFNLHTN